MMMRWHAFATHAAVRWPSRLTTLFEGFALAAFLASVVGFAASPAHAAAAQSRLGAPLDVAIETKGSLPGFSNNELPDYFANAMNATDTKGWHFVPQQAGRRLAADRIELSFETNAYAAGTVRTYGISRATMERLLNVHHSITIEARLFLGDQYQTLFFEQVTVSGGPHDAELDEAVAKLTRALTSYPALKTESSGAADFALSHAS